jgi:integrase
MRDTENVHIYTPSVFRILYVIQLSDRVYNVTFPAYVLYSLRRSRIKIYLSQIYTNHSIRATGATIIGRNCSMAQIMAVTGHKSASSVAVYQRVSSKEKRPNEGDRKRTYIPRLFSEYMLTFRVE